VIGLSIYTLLFTGVDAWVPYFKLMQTSNNPGSLSSALQKMDLRDDKAINSEADLFAELERINKVFPGSFHYDDF